MPRGQQVQTLFDLNRLAECKKSVIGKHGCIFKHTPASTVMQMQAKIVFEMMQMGMWEYIKKGDSNE